MESVHIIGGGLAGCEAAWQLAQRGVPVRVIEMRPRETTGAHRTDRLAEIVCTNSFKSTLPETASGLLKAELDILDCYLLSVARSAQVPAGHALAIDRDVFSRTVTDFIENHPGIELQRRCQNDLDFPRPAIVATGPLTSKTLSAALRDHCSDDHLYFYDAIAPSIDGDSLGAHGGYWASRYDKGDADYLNIPLSRAQYLDLLDKIRNAEIVKPHSFEEPKYFEACLPVEEMVARGEDTLRFGPLKPRGLIDPHTGREPYGVIQLRQESKSGNLLGLVGFQTRMTYAAQKTVIRSVPGLEDAKILRFGSIHRNIFLNIPVLCDRYQRDRKIRGLFYAGQICGVEGYVECIASGMIAALSVYADLLGRDLLPLPAETMIGSLMNYIHTATTNFQPMNANMGIIPKRGKHRGPRKDRYLATADRAVAAMSAYRRENDWCFASASPHGFRRANFA
jgi:methylenetetrahydrofolate--tRNA-(uracil-5-)-methyltransferase